MIKHDLRCGPSIICSTHLLWRGWRVESAGTDQEGVRLRFALLHLRIITQNNVVKQTEKVFVLARLQLERHTSWAGCHCNGDTVFLQMVNEFLHTWWYTRCKVRLKVRLLYQSYKANVFNKNHSLNGAPPQTTASEYIFILIFNFNGYRIVEQNCGWFSIYSFKDDSILNLS